MSEDRFEEFEKRAREVDPFKPAHSTGGWVAIVVVFLVSCVLWFYAGPSYLYRFVITPPSKSDTSVPGEASVSSGMYLPTGDGTIPRRREDELAIVFLHVGYGDGILVQTPDNRTTLIDGGEGTQPEEEGVQAYDWAHELYFPLFSDLGIGRLYRLISTTPLSHHMGAQAGLMADKRLDVDEVLVSGYPSSFYSSRRREIVSRNQNIPVQDMKAGQELQLGAGLKTKVLYGRNSAKSPESASHVLLLKYGGIKFLLMSDLPTKEEKKMVLEWGKSLNANVLKVGTHGSRDSTSLELLRFVDPDQAVISVPQRNPINAPHEEAMDRLKKAGIQDSQLYRTDMDGHIGFFTDGNEIRVESDILRNY